MRHGNNNRGPREIRTRITVTAAECNDNPDKMVRRFTKKVKNEGILEEARNRATYTKPSEVRRLKKAAERKKIEKANKQRQALLIPRDIRRSKARR